jgi:type IV secretory pathway TraG/TraD family ATPase VirD4
MQIQIDPASLAPAAAAGAVDAPAWAGVPYILILVALVAFVVGVVAGHLLQQFSQGRGLDRNKPRYPRDWPRTKDILTNNPDPTKPGYMSLPPRKMLGSGAMAFGRTMPRFSIFPDMYPFREWRRRVEYWSSRPIQIPYMKRMQHMSVLGATGKGKSTALALPVLAYGALEKNTSYVCVDVKSPEFLRLFSTIYRSWGKKLVFFDPFSDETLAFEPLWRTSDEDKKIIAEVLATYSIEVSQQSSSENSEFFKVAAVRLLNGLMDLARMTWPRRMCNLPCVQQLVAAGGNAIAEAFEKAPDNIPSLEATMAAINAILPASAGDLRRAERSEMLTYALRVLDRSGYPTARAVKRMRKLEEEFRAGKLDQQKIEEIRRAFWAQIRHEWIARREKLDILVQSQGEFIMGADETKASIVATLVNKVGWFSDPSLARGFSRDELNYRSFAEEPTLFIIGTPLSKKNVGAMFVGALLSNLAINALYDRGNRKAKGEKVWGGGVFYLLDEFPQLAIKSAPDILATFRSYLGGLICIYQERGQLKQLYGENATTMEGNMVHAMLFSGAHPETAEFFAQKKIGEANIRKESKSGVKGEKENISESIESVPLMTTAEVIQMKLNGAVQQAMALSVGADLPSFPFRLVPFYEDPELRRLLKLKRSVSRKGYEGQATWKFWEWGERWEPTEDGPRYLTRQIRKTPAERAAGVPDPVHQRLSDPFTQYLDYLVGRQGGDLDELEIPRLVLSDIWVVENDPRANAERAAQGGGGVPGHGRPGVPEPASQPVLLSPHYQRDMQILTSEDFRDREYVEERPAMGGAIDARVRVLQGDY